MGLFITFEGVEGSGKSTQIRLLREALLAEGRIVHTTREPGGERFAENIRNAVLAAGYVVDPVAELFAFLAARAQVTRYTIREHLKRGDVLCDRFIDSTVAYQGYARGIDIDTVRYLNRLATGELKFPPRGVLAARTDDPQVQALLPDLTILLDLDAELGLSRQSDRNRMENELPLFHRRVREGYLAEAALDPQRFRVIDAAKPVDQIHREILAYVRPLLPRTETDKE